MNLITLQYNSKTGTTARNILSYGTDDAALSALYQSMRASINDTNIAKITAILMDDSGVTHKFESWQRVPEHEPEPEEE